MKTTGIIVLILVIFAAAVLAEVWRELHCFKITRYRIRTSKIKGDAGKVRIAFLSDLHNHVYGKENEELLLAIREAKPDLILLDIMLPGIDGYDVCREIRKTSTVPIIMLSARQEEYDKLFGFEIGADDYVTKPFSPKEVMARINAVTKRRAMKNNDVSQQSYKFEGLEIDKAGRKVNVDGEKAQHTPKEYQL